MSLEARQQGPWPASSYARFLWLAFGLWKDIQELADVYKASSQAETRLVIARHTIVDFDSLDELIKEFHDHIKQEELNRLNPSDRQRLTNAFGNYHRKVQPHRELLKKIRNNLGSHRTGLPWSKAPQSGVTSADEWGKWEQLLVSLEDECDLTKWILIFNAAHELLYLLKDFNLDAWYSGGPGVGAIQFVMPLLPPGYYPTKEPSD